MKIVTSHEMRRIDQLTIEEWGIPSSVLMDRAGKAVAHEAVKRFEPDMVVVITGKGNNAGDGFVAACELHRMRIPTTLVLLRSPDELSGDTLNAWRQVPDDMCCVEQPDTSNLCEQLAHCDLVIDAIFGTGVKGVVKEPWSDFIEVINTSRLPVLSVDIPSGLPGEITPEIGSHVRATVTVTLGLPKLGMVVGPAGVRATGQIVVDNIGFPNDLLKDASITTNLLTVAEMRAMQPQRLPEGHKGTFGRAMILGGSEGMTGAAVLAAQAAARSGTGLVYSCYPRPLGMIMESHLVEPVKIPLAGESCWFTSDHTDQAISEAVTMQAVAIGPGLGRRPETAIFLKEIIQNVTAPLVIDADGLNLLAEQLEILANRSGPTVLTPHSGEAARLLKCDVAQVEANRLGVFVKLSQTQGVVVVLKGARTVVTAPDGQRYINPTGNNGLAKGGSGDVLTGLIVGLLAQGIEASMAARLGVFLHGMAADLAAERVGLRAMIPSDVINYIASAFLKLQRGN